MKINKVVNSITTMEPYMSKHILMQYDNLLMQNTNLKTKQKSLQLHASNVDTQWNLVQDMLQTNLQTLFGEHNTYEASYIKRFKAYREAYPKFTYDSIFVTFENSSNTVDFNKYGTCPSGETHEV